MNRFQKRSIAVVLLTLVLVFGLFAQSIREVQHGEYYGKTVILHSNDVHGAIDGYIKMMSLRASFWAEEADVLIADAGDFSQGSEFVSHDKGLSAVELMNLACYDYAAIGNHDLDYGYEQLRQNLQEADFTPLCCNVIGPDGYSIGFDYAVYQNLQGIQFGFIGILTPETRTKAKPTMVEGLTFLEGDDLYRKVQDLVDELRSQGVNTVFCLTHLGEDASSAPYRSVDIFEKVDGIDFIIDAHSHSVYTELDGYPIQQTGTEFQNIGVIIADSNTGRILNHYLVPCDDIPVDLNAEYVEQKVQSLHEELDKIYSQTIARSDVVLNGDRAPGNRTQETNHGDLICDALLWFFQDDESIKVPADHRIAITNGGGIRTAIEKGDVTMQNVDDVLPFKNTVCVVYVKGSELLEVLEASTFCLPEAIGGFPQVSGIEYTIDTTKAYDSNAETYPGSTYFGPKSIQRVTIDSVNGQPFDKDATYAVMTNDFCAAGGDTYHAFASAQDQFDTGINVVDAVVDYITEALGGVIDERYAEPAGRISIIQ